MPSAHRVVEIRDERHPDWIRERCVLRGDQRHGLSETFDVYGLVSTRTHYDAGVKHGLHEWLCRDGSVTLRGSYERGRPHGRWESIPTDGCFAVEVDYDHGEVKESRIHMPDGTVLAAGPIADVSELPSWSSLAAAWHASLTDPAAIDSLQIAVDGRGDDWTHRALAWMHARMDAGERVVGSFSSYSWSCALLERDEDPRHDWLDGLVADHIDITEEALPRIVRRSHRLTRLELVETTVEGADEPTLAALFRPPADWSALRQLRIEEYWHDDPLPALLDVELPALRELALIQLPIRYEDGPNGRIAPTLLDLARAPFWARLRRLVLDGVGSYATWLALARYPMPELEELVLASDEDEDGASEAMKLVLAAWYDPTLRPKLAPRA